MQKSKRRKNQIKHQTKRRYKQRAGSLSFKQSNCGPVPISERGNKPKKSCYSNDHLVRLKNAWNKRNPSNLIHSTDSDIIWTELKNNLETTCSNESCWYKNFTEVNELTDMKDLFAPTSPTSWKSNPNEWLSSTDIKAVMKQYSKIYKCFEFIGPVPIDFDKVVSSSCVSEELCKLNLQKLINAGKFKIGISLNTDPHDKGGEHWISMFINVKKGLIFFFDSAGDKAPKQVVTLANRIIKQGKELTTPIQFKFDQNYPKQHQYTSTECGMYSLYFIVSMLEDKLTQQYLKTHIITDKYIEKLRKVYYNDN